ncbi:uncharacterized transporter Sly41p [Diutina catenulata]
MSTKTQRLPPYLSSINPNSSSTNLSQVGGKIQHPVPNRGPFAQFALPLTPPRSKVSSPVSKGPEPTGLAKYLPPIDWRVVTLCSGWYLTSIISSNSTKMILTRFPYPITLTEGQFIFNCLFSVLFVVLLSMRPNIKSRFPRGTFPLELPSIIQFLTPTRHVLATTLPMGCFQFVGHLSSHKATSLVPVSLVHTVKALAPLCTVLIYRVLFKTKYKRVTYLTLIPLVVGIMITCYKPKKIGAPTHYWSGLTYALVSMMIFVSQNIFSKKRLTVEQEGLPGASKKEEESKVDKLTILFYCSAIGFSFTLPIYLVAEMRSATFSMMYMTPTILALMVLNGFSHFVQSFLAFQILGLMTPINYSIANIMKRIIIILVAFICERKQFTSLQCVGLFITMIGLYSYDRWGVAKK